MKFIAVSAITLALAFLGGISLANPIPCAGCVLPGGAKAAAPDLHGLDGVKLIEKSTLATSTVSPDCQGCVQNVARVRAADSSDTTDCQGCVQNKARGLENVGRLTNPMVPMDDASSTIDCQGCVQPTPV